MSNPNLTRSHNSNLLSMIGGAAQGDSAKPKEQREQRDREHDQPQDDSPAGASESKGTVGGISNDNRTDQDRASDSRTS